jgi:hypothetical protein
VEQATWSALLKFTMALTPAKFIQAAKLATASYQADNWVVAAEGAGKLERIRLCDGKTIRCDYLAVAYGFVPNTELAAIMCGESIYCAGEVTGIGGVDLSLVEGEIAGYRAAGREDLARKLFPARDATQRFADALNRTFAPRAELRSLAAADTIVCRCEDVPLARLQGADSWRSAKLHFRCGMGPCQGRVCGPAVEFLFPWKVESIRPPVFPARVASLISKKEVSIK